MRKPSLHEAKRLLGKAIYAKKKDGTIVTGRLVRIHQGRLYLSSLDPKKRVRTKGFILPLVLFDLLAVGLVSTNGFYGGGCGPYGGGAYGAGIPGQYPYGGVGGFNGYPNKGFY